MKRAIYWNMICANGLTRDAWLQQMRTKDDMSVRASAKALCLNVTSVGDRCLEMGWSNPNHVWVPGSFNEDKAARLRELWPDLTLSTSEIGRRLNVSKNAVIGKAHRMKLQPRPSPIRAKNTPEQKQAADRARYARYKAKKKAEVHAQRDLVETSVPDKRHHRSSVTPEWPQVEIDRLTALWAEGMPVSAISKTLRRSINSVVGKAHRLSLTPLPSPIIRGRAPKPAPVKRAPLQTLPTFDDFLDDIDDDQEHEFVQVRMPREKIERSKKVRECMFTDGQRVNGRTKWHFCPNDSLPGRLWCAEHSYCATSHFVSEAPADAAPGFRFGGGL